MIDFDYLLLGLQGLAHAHLAGTMAGHLGAALAAGYFYGEDRSELPAEVFAGITGELQRIIAGEEAIWWNVKQSGVAQADLFRPLPEEPAAPEQIATIVDALVGNMSQLRQSGHNVIFAAIALRALQDHQQLATPTAIAGVRKLIAGFDRAHPGRGYFGKATGWRNGDQAPLPPETGFPPYQTLQAMVETTLRELIATAGTRKQGFGGLWHIINHAAAILELHRLGFSQAAQRGLPAHHQHIRLWRALPDVAEELGPVVKSQHDPREPAYWAGMLQRDEARLTHRIKTLYGYETLRRYSADAALLQEADEAFLYLMA